MSKPLDTLSTPPIHNGWMQNFSSKGLGGEPPLEEASSFPGCSKSPNRYPVRRLSNTPRMRLLEVDFPTLLSTKINTGNISARRSGPSSGGGGMVSPNLDNKDGLGCGPPISVQNLMGLANNTTPSWRAVARVAQPPVSTSDSLLRL